jgi:hypothetical protein
MLRTKAEKKFPNDYKEPYEFRLLIGDSIICQRYFKINNFNHLSLSSVELTNTIRYCANLINEDLKSKSRMYSWHMCPMIFDDEEQMLEWFSNPVNYERINSYETIVIRNNENGEYIWDVDDKKLIKCEKKTDDGTFTNPLTERDILTYELAFYVNDKKVVSTSFEGVYPYYIRRNIDLSNTRGKFEGEDLTRLSFDSYIINRLVYDRQDLIKKVVKEICLTCSVPDNSYYTLTEVFKTNNGKTKTYNLVLNDQKEFNAKYAKEIAKAREYYYGSGASKDSKKNKSSQK